MDTDKIGNEPMWKSAKVQPWPDKVEDRLHALETGFEEYERRITALEQQIQGLQQLLAQLSQF